MHDNAAIHTAHIVQDWFAENNIQTVEWLPYSPDLNPIENLWKMLKAKIIELHAELITMKDNDTIREHLINSAEEAWELLEEDMLNKLASEMQKR
jgi:transposase